MRKIAGTSKAGYFKAIKAAKNKHWSSFLLAATPQSLWTAKRFAYGRAQPRFPSLPGAETPLQMNDVPLNDFFPPKDPFSPPPRLRPHKSAPPLMTEEIAAALSTCSPTSAPGPDGIPYSTWKQVNKINPSILLQILAPLVLLGYHPASLKGSNGVVLDKPGKPSYESTLLLQDYCPDPNVLKDPQEDYSSRPTHGSPAQRAVAPKPMRFAP